MAVTEQVCIRCGEAKPAEGNFKRSGQSATGYIRLCDACRAAEQAAVTDLTCDRCGQTKVAAGNFYRNAQATTGYRGTCIACVKAEERAYRTQAAAQAAAREAQRRVAQLEAGRYAGIALLNCNERVAKSLKPGQQIYALVDPRTGAVCYVGRSRTPEARYRRHLREASPARVCLFSKDAWLWGLRQAGVRPGLRILEAVADPATAWERESRWILHLLKRGAPLTNSDARCHRLVAEVRVTPLDCLTEPLDSEAWLPLYQAWQRDRSDWDRARRDGSHARLGLIPCATCADFGFRCGLPRPGGWPGSGATEEEFAASALLFRCS